MCGMPKEQGSMVDMFDLVRMEKGVAPLGDSDAATEYKEEKSGAPAKAGASQTATSGVANPIAAQPASAQVAPGVTVKGYGGKGTRNVRNTVRADDYSDINKRRARKTASAMVGL